MLQTVICSSSYTNTCKALKEKYDKISETGSFFAIINTEYYDNGDVMHDVFDIISCACELGYQYINTIVVPNDNIDTSKNLDNVRYIVWLCKSRELFDFNKDVIREKHIWKDVEWGKREKNYNPKGKDPGNVWIPTLDDGKANITHHILLTEEEIVRRLINMTNAGTNYEYIDTCNETDAYSDSFILNNNEKKQSIRQVIFNTSEKMHQIKNNSVGVVITSPPYWNLKDYFKEGQIGQETYEQYICRMSKVWKECYKKLYDGGTLWININIRVHDGKVILIPKDIIESCKKIGYHYKGILIWHKSSGIPTGDRNIVDRHEYVLVFSKTETFYLDKGIFNGFSDYKNTNINGGLFWNINRKAGSVGKKWIHPAIYPNELVRRIIVATTKENDVVLDPFLGSGTTIIAAVNENRSAIGYEFNEGFEELIQCRFNNEIKDKQIRIKYLR